MGRIFCSKKSLEVGEEADWTLGGPDSKLTATPKNMNSKDDFFGSMDFLEPCHSPDG